MKTNLFLTDIFQFVKGDYLNDQDGKQFVISKIKSHYVVVMRISNPKRHRKYLKRIENGKRLSGKKRKKN